MADAARILEALVNPVGVVWALNVVAAVVLGVKRKWRGAVFCGSVTLLLFIFGSTPVSFHLLASLERPYASQARASIPMSDAIVMLGGTVLPSEHDPLGFQMGKAGDRVVTALELARQGKAPVLILGGGGKAAQGWSESRLLTNWSQAWNISVGKILTIPVCANTREEAMHVRALCDEHKWTRVILVTSAYHMKRTEALFRKLGIPVVPVACDFEGLSYLNYREPFNPIPRPNHFEAVWLYTHEIIGWWVYRCRGWVSAAE